MSSQAKQSVAPAINRNAALDQEGLGSHWTPLDDWAREKYQEIVEGDNFAHRVMARHIHQLPNWSPMEEKEIIIHLIRSFLDLTTGHASVEDAAVYLARSSWDPRLATYRWIDPENWEAIEKDETWGDEKSDQSNHGKPLESYETIRSVRSKSSTQSSVIGNASLIEESRHIVPLNEDNHCLPFAPSTTGTIHFGQKGRSLAGSKAVQNNPHSELTAEAHASEDSTSINSTVATRAEGDEDVITSGTTRQRPELMNRPSLENDADSDANTSDFANPTSDQTISSTLDREIHPPANRKTSRSTATARAPDVGSSSRTPYATGVATLNPDLDRSPAILGQIMPEKLKVQFQLPHTNNIKRLYFHQLNYGRSFDWDNVEHIRKLNRWRAQLFRRIFGSTKNRGRNFHEEEDRWLTEQYLQHRETALRHGRQPDYHTMNWVVIAKAFNQHFEGHVLPGCDEPRRHRTKNSIMTHRYRIDAISKMTGVPLKGGKREMEDQELAEEVTDSDPEATVTEESENDAE